MVCIFLFMLMVCVVRVCLGSVSLIGVVFLCCSVRCSLWLVVWVILVMW